MTYDKALQVLELSSGFSEEELKKSYRRKARLWHPDVNKSPEADEKFKEVHEAYEVLKNKTNVFNGTGGIGLVMAKMQIVNQMHSYTSNLFKLNNEELRSAVNTYIREVNILIRRYEGLVQNGTRLSEVTRYYEEFKREVKSKLNIIKESFLDINPYFKNINVNYNYELDAYNFVLSLEKIKKETEETITRRITDGVVSKYSLYAGYEEVKGEIYYCITECIENIFKGNAMDKEIVNLASKIELVFKNSFDKTSRKNEVKRLLEEMKDIDSLKIRQRVDKLLKNINSDDFYDEIDFLSFQVKSIKNGSYIEAIRLHLNDKYRAATIRCKSKVERENIFKIYNDAISFLDRVDDGLLGFDILYSLFDIKFEDIKKDSELLDFISNRDNKINVGYVYVAKNTISAFGYLYLQEDSYQMKYKSYMGVNKLDVKTKADIVEDFVSLSEYLSKANFIGKRMITKSGASIDILYELDGRALALTTKGRIFTVDMSSILINSNRINTELEIYQDKDKVLEKVIDRVDQDFIKKSKR